jgi:hypothetical protein
MKTFIIDNEEKKRILNLHESFKKKVVSEQYTKIEGPFIDRLEGVGNVYIMKLEKSLCRWDGQSKSQAFGDNTSVYTGQVFQMTGSTCGEGFTTISAGKFYIQFHNTSSGKIEMFNSGSRYYVTATNNGQGYTTQEEAKKGVSLLLNPDGKVGRNVQKTELGKTVSKYNQQGDLKSVKVKYSGGTEKYKTGL